MIKFRHCLEANINLESIADLMKYFLVEPIQIEENCIWFETNEVRFVKFIHIFLEINPDITTYRHAFCPLGYKGGYVGYWVFDRNKGTKEGYLEHGSDEAKEVSQILNLWQDPIKMSLKTIQLVDRFFVGYEIDQLGLSIRAYNCLRRANKTEINQLVLMTKEELLAIRGMGRKCADEIERKLQEKGYILKDDKITFLI